MGPASFLRHYLRIARPPQEPIVHAPPVNAVSQCQTTVPSCDAAFPGLRSQTPRRPIMSLTFKDAGKTAFHAVLAASNRSLDIPEAADAYGWLVGDWELDDRKSTRLNS